ncbi:MAG: hypothetical protein Q8K82_21855 [Gemmatimonadaceae bacterium]|nr:hypothetical protein [Gemmatimonadaceae bacterium]
MKSRLLLAVALLSAAPRLLVSQTAQQWSVQASALLVRPSGEAFVDTKSGPGFELQLRRNSSPWSVGGGVQYSRHDIGASDPLSLVGIFLEPRFILPFATSQAAPYASARVAVFQQRLSASGVTGKATGGQINAGGGVLLRLSKNANLDVGATIGYLKFGEFVIAFPEGGGITSKAASGTNIVLRAGLALGLGK